MKLKIIVLILSNIFLEHIYSQSARIKHVADLIGDNEIISVNTNSEEYQFNSKGQLLLAQGFVFTDSIVYNQNGNIKAIYTYKYEELRDKIILKYDENNKIITADYFVPVNKKDHLVNTLLFESQKKTPNGIIKNYKFKEGNSTLQFHFNNQGLMKKEITIHPLHGYYWQEEIEYFDFSNKKRKKSSIINNILFENKWVLYHNKNNEGIISEFNNSQSTNFAIKSKKNIQKNLNFTRINRYEYDSKGNVSKMTEEQFKNDELEKKIVYEYKYVYDNRGNWTNKIIYYNGKKDSNINRTILYR
ncbi:hypothetical protein LS482_17055 [Sinomicrobium kalidii]|uniref:hypothetical protein n=1 Tax=Sinomicrobium kalidii TaxID=2900738 RepID=UPI001E2928C0|nr:hypothetical protein [Sinomicrobium kalidii]UGU15379.1 hypothetical protein LS482_17055 [Sinomicrobium kalidii]